MFIRAPWVEKVGPDVEVVATRRPPDRPRVGSSRSGRAHLLATSFHPEITGDHRFHQLFVDLVRAPTRS